MRVNYKLPFYEHDKHIGSVGSGSVGEGFHPLWYNAKYKAIFKGYGLKYHSHSKSTRSNSMYFFFNDGDICIRLSDHDLKGKDVDMSLIDINDVFMAISKKI